MRLSFTLAASALAGMVLTAPARGQAPGESFTATASVKSDAVTGTVPVSIVIKHWATDAERAKLMKTLKSGGTLQLKAALAKMRDSGTLTLAKTTGAVKYAYATSTGSGRIVTVLTAKPLYHLGGGLPDAKPKAGYDVVFRARGEDKVAATKFHKILHDEWQRFLKDTPTFAMTTWLAVVLKVR